ncbi:conserved hypothetical protein [Bordetella petrii]|uniref:Uncharacterized protein n=2 Tax=Bordetella petrii TaxID=94624 RepID=A9HY24_BORPD|nr:conserved hypothetical protein [Bordetella petrii]
MAPRPLRVEHPHLMDRGLFDFAGLKPTGRPDANGDTAFDPIDPEDPREDAGDACASSPADGDAAMAEQKVVFARL